MMTNKRKIIIGLAGEMGCGKGTAAEYIVKKYNGKSSRFSSILRDLLKRLYLPEIRENIQDISTVLRERFGQDILARAMASDVQNCSEKIIVIDGIRRREDMKYLKEMPGFVLVYMEAGAQSRYERISKRGENPDDSVKTFEQFKKELGKESEIKIRELKDGADFLIDNSGELTGLYKQIDDLIAQSQK